MFQNLLSSFNDHLHCTRVQGDELTISSIYQRRVQGGHTRERRTRCILNARTEKLKIADVADGRFWYDKCDHDVNTYVARSNQHGLSRFRKKNARLFSHDMLVEFY